MSVSSVENNYKTAKSLYHEVSDDFYDIENNGAGEDDSYLIDTALENVKRLNRYLNRINLDELEDSYDNKVIDVLDSNVDTFREGAYYIERALMSMKLFDKLHPVLDEYLKSVNYNIIADDIDGAILKLGSFMTSEDNYEQYKTIINNIVKGTMKKKAFQDFFNAISNRIAKPKKKDTEAQVQGSPPEMWSEKDQDTWEQMKIEKKKEAAKLEKKYKEKEVAVDFDESFVSFQNYKKLHESEDEL